MKSLIFSIPLLLLSCNRKEETVTPELKKITESVYASGFVRSKNQYEVYPKVNGIVNRITVNEGEYVKKGQLLFIIDNPNAKLLVNNSMIFALTNDYKQNIEKLEDVHNSIQLAHKNLNNDSLLYERQKSLWNQNVGSKVELEKRALAFEKSKVSLNQLQVTYNDLKRQLEVASQQSKNNLKISQNAEKDLEIRSNVDGIVYKVNIKEGELALTNKALAIIGEQNFIIELNVDELDIVKIKKGQKVFIRMDSYKSNIFEAKITDVRPMMNERTRTFEVEANFSNKPEVLYINLTLEANIVIEEKNNVLTIPTRYLLSDSSVVLEDGSVQKIEIGLRDFNLSEIKSGINLNSKIIIPKK